jgi:Cu-Zn family superoxide dismutase
MYTHIGCLSTGVHYNPFNETHGGPNSKIRHVGDYGNLVAPASGPAILSLNSDSTKLSGKTSFIG